MTVSSGRVALLKRELQRAADARDACAVASAWRAVLDYFNEVSTTRIDPEPSGDEADYESLWNLAECAMSNLGGQSEPALQTLADYDAEQFGPMLGVSDEGSATAAIRQGALAAPKAVALTDRTPLTLGIAHDAERLGAVGEVAVGPDEFATIRLACRGRVLTTTNVGTRVNVRLFLDSPQVTVRAGSIDKAITQLERAFAPFLKTPSGRSRSITVFIRLDPKLSDKQRGHALNRLQRGVAGGKFCNPKKHKLGLLLTQGRGEKWVASTFKGITLAAKCGIGEVAMDGEIDGLRPDELTEILRIAAAKKVKVISLARIDPQTTARHVWTGLSVARNMGLELGKYGLVPLPFEAQREVIARIQFWFPFWCAAPVYYIDYPLITATEVFHGPRIVAGIRLWLKMVSELGVRVVLIDTAKKSEGRHLLKDSADDDRGLLSSDEVASLTAFARTLGVRVLWAGGISLQQAYTLGRLGVFGIYVTTAAAALKPLDRKSRIDPFLTALREPRKEDVTRVKMLLEAGFLIGRGAHELEQDTNALLNAIAAKDEPRTICAQSELHPHMVEVWRKHFQHDRAGNTTARRVS